MVDSRLGQLDLARLAKKLVSEDGFRDLAFAHEAILEYKKFFFMLAESEYTGSNDDRGPEDRVRGYLPSAMIDLVWQRHMLDTARYFQDCERFDMPGGYCHRHELFDADEYQVASLCSHCGYAQADYSFTLQEYERAFGSAPRDDIWPQQYELMAPQHKKRKAKVRRDEELHERQYLSFAVPHMIVPYCETAAIRGMDKYTVPNEETLMAHLLWVGELVFDTLPQKQVRSLPGEAIGRISMGVQRRKAVMEVVREYARFLILVMRKNYGDMIATHTGNDTVNSSMEVTPSKLVDELWHAHILNSPAYFSFW
jgi:hypothetical protein